MSKLNPLLNCWCVEYGGICIIVPRGMPIPILTFASTSTPCLDVVCRTPICCFLGTLTTIVQTPKLLF